MKMFRLFSAALLALILGTAVSAQDSAEITSLRAKAERGNGIAQYNLGLAYMEGRGTASDPVAAYVWLSLARENGTRGRALDALIGSLDKATLEAAQQKLAAFKAANDIKTLVRTEPAPAKPVSAGEGDTPRSPPGAPAPAPAAPPPPNTAPGEDPALARLRTERDAQAARVTELTAEVAALRADRQRLLQQTATTEKSTQAATDANRALQEKARAAETQVAELSRDTEAAKAELARTKQALAALESAPKPAPDTTALEAKTRELQAALTELETARSFGRQVEDTLNKVNDEKARVAAAAAAELEAARKFGQQVEATLNRVNDEKAALASQLAATTADATRARQEAATLAQANQALAAKPAAPAYPDLSGRVAELENQLASAKQPVAPAYPDLRSNVTALEAQLAAARSAQPAYPDLSGKVTELTAALAARPAAPAYPDLTGRVSDLESQLTKAHADLSAVDSAKAELSGQVGALKGQLATLTRSAADLSSEAAKARQESAALAKANEETQQALAAARSAKPAYPDLSGRVAELEGQLAKARQPVAPAYPDLRGNVTALEAQLAAAKSAQPAYPDLREQTAALESQLAALNAGSERSKQTIATLTQNAAAAEQALAAAQQAKPAYPDLSGKVAELEAALAAKPAAPAYPDLSGQVSTLEKQVAALNAESERNKQTVVTLTQSSAAAEQALAAARQAKPAYPDLSGKVAELEAALAAKPAAPAYPNLTGRVAELEGAVAESLRRLSEREVQLKQLAEKPAAPAYPDLSSQVKDLEKALADTNRQLIAAQNAKPAAPAYPDLSAKVAGLEAASAKAREEAAQKVAAAELARAELSKQFDAYRSATVASQRESTTLQASIKMLESDKASFRRQAENASTEAAALRTQVAVLKTAAAAIRPAAPAYPDLSGRVHELEAQLAAKPAAPAYPDLRDRVAELEASEKTLRQGYDSSLQNLDRQLQAAKAAAQPAAPAYPDLSGKVRELDAKVASLGLASQAAEAQASGLMTERDTARAAQAELRDTVAKLAQDKAALAADLETARKAAPAYPDLSGQVSALEKQLAALNAESERSKQTVATLTQSAAAAEQALAAARQAKPAYPDLSGKVAELEAALAAKPAAPAYPDLSGRVSELETKLAAAGKAAPAYPDLSAKVGELESTISNLTGEIAQAKQSRAELSKQFDAYKSATVASQRESTTLQASVKMLESDKASLRRQADTATAEAASLRTQVAALKTAAATAKPAYPDLSDKVTALENQLVVLAAKPAAPAYPDLSGKVADLESKLAATEKSLAEKPAAPANPDLSGKVAELESALGESNRKLAAANSAMVELQQDVSAARRPVAPPGYLEHMRELETALAQAKAAAQPAAPAYPDLSGRVSELEAAQAGLKQQLADATTAAQHAAQAGNDTAQLRRERDELSGRVTSLAGEVASLRSDRERMQKMLGDAGQQMRDGAADAARIKELEARLTAAGQQGEAANLQIARLRMAVDAKPAAPAYPNLSDKVAELENQIAGLTRARDEAAKAGTTPAYPDLSGKVAELESSLAATQRRLTDSQAALVAEQAKPAAIATTTPAVPAADTSDLQKQLAETEDKLAISLRGYAALQRERDALAENASKSAADGNAQNTALTARLTDVEGRVAATQAEADRAKEELGALRRSTASTTNDLAATRTLVQQLQGSNTVLASENYRLKTLLASSGGTPAPAGATVSAPTGPALRTHVVASGDSLSRISQRYYGNASRWPDIYNANRDKIGADGVLRVGVELRIP